MTPEEVAKRQKAERLRADRALRADLADDYQKVWRRIRKDLDRLIADIQAAQAAGEQVSPAWLLQRDRLTRLEREAQAQVRFFADLADRRVTAAQLDALQAGQLDARELLLASLGPQPFAGAFTPALPVRPLEELAGRTSNGQPLRLLLDQLGPDASRRVRGVLLEGVAVGQNPRRIAAQARAAFAGNLARALNIARTETLGVYRTAALETFRSNEAVTTGWVWLAQLSHRTCPVCWAMHGTVHTLDESLDSHPSCRCTMAPQTLTWEQLGFTGLSETRPAVEAGEAVFARADEVLQRAVLGPGKFAAYQSGRLRLADLVQPTVSPVWGAGLRERSLRDALTVAV